MSSIAALKKELKALGVDAKTPGLKGDARRDELRRRLQEASAAPAPERRPPRPSGRKKPSERVTNATISALKAALDSLGVDTKTPGIRGEERKRALEERLAAVHAPEDSDEGEGAGGSEAREAEEEDEAYEEMGELWAEEAARRKRRHAQQQLHERSAQRQLHHRDSPSKPMTGGASKSRTQRKKTPQRSLTLLVPPPRLFPTNTVPSVCTLGCATRLDGVAADLGAPVAAALPEEAGKATAAQTHKEGPSKSEILPLPDQVRVHAPPPTAADHQSQPDSLPGSRPLRTVWLMLSRPSPTAGQRFACSAPCARRTRRLPSAPLYCERVWPSARSARNADLADLVDRLNAVSRMKELMRRAKASGRHHFNSSTASA